MSEHTPVPWSSDEGCDDGGNGRFSVYCSGEGEPIVFTPSHGAHFRDHGAHEPEESNVKFIVRACNAHADLLAACEAVIKDIQASVMDMQEGIDSVLVLPTTAAQVRAAIAKATEQETNMSWTIEEIEEANRKAGHCWLSADTLQFFGQCIEDFEVFENGGRVFVFAAAHRGWDSPDLSSFAEFNPGTGRISSIEHPEGISEQWTRDEVLEHVASLEGVTA